MDVGLYKQTGASNGREKLKRAEFAARREPEQKGKSHGGRGVSAKRCHTRRDSPVFSINIDAFNLDIFLFFFASAHALHPTLSIVLYRHDHGYGGEIQRDQVGGPGLV